MSSLSMAVDRLMVTGWQPDAEATSEQLSDGRPYPSVLTVQAEFARAGLELAIKHNLIFRCYRANWVPAGELLDESHAIDEAHGTVVGGCEREAAVYALAQLRSSHVNV